MLPPCARTKVGAPDSRRHAQLAKLFTRATRSARAALSQYEGCHDTLLAFSRRGRNTRKAASQHVHRYVLATRFESGILSKSNLRVVGIRSRSQDYLRPRRDNRRNGSWIIL